MANYKGNKNNLSILSKTQNSSQRKCINMIVEYLLQSREDLIINSKEILKYYIPNKVFTTYYCKYANKKK